MSPAVHIYTIPSPTLRSQFGQTVPGPALFAVKRIPGTPTKDLKPQASMVFSHGTTKEDIHAFLDRHKFPLVTEMDSENFQSVMNAKFQPLVILLATVPESKMADANMLAAAEQRWRTSEA